MINPDKIIQEILQQFKTLKPADTNKWNKTQRTRKVLTALCKIGKETFHCSVYASRHFVHEQYRNGGEWLYDITWCEYKNSLLKSVPLVAECEWGTLGAIKDDFDKLILARAAVRVMVYDGGYSKDGAEGIANDLCRRVGAFEGNRPGDTYLLAGYDKDESSSWFRYFKILVDDPGQQPVLERL